MRPGRAFQMVVATGSPITALAGERPASLATRKSGFDLLDPVTRSRRQSAVRAQFRNLSMLHLPLGMVGGGTGAIVPGGVLGGDLLRALFGRVPHSRPAARMERELLPSMTFWAHLSADLGFLQDAGYAVIRFTPYGGGETSALGDEDFLGERGPLVLPPTRVVMRTCAVPVDFTPDVAAHGDMCCTRCRRRTAGDGVDLSLMLATGLGPMMLSRSALARSRRVSWRAPRCPCPRPCRAQCRWQRGRLPIDVGWSTHPPLRARRPRGRRR